MIELIEIFREDTPRMLADIAAALGEADAGGLHRASHALKGQVGNYSAEGALRAASDFDDAARSGDIDAARLLHGNLMTAIEELGTQLEAFRQALQGRQG